MAYGPRWPARAGGDAAADGRRDHRAWPPRFTRRGVRLTARARPAGELLVWSRPVAGGPGPDHRARRESARELQRITTVRRRPPSAPAARLRSLRHGVFFVRLRLTLPRTAARACSIARRGLDLRLSDGVPEAADPGVVRDLLVGVRDAPDPAEQSRDDGGLHKPRNPHPRRPVPRRGGPRRDPHGAPLPGAPAAHAHHGRTLAPARALSDPSPGAGRLSL